MRWEERRVSCFFLFYFVLLWDLSFGKGGREGGYVTLFNKNGLVELWFELLHCQL